jgi:UDP-GlcNAc:undecaprenyl-phosphate GlcNAc-1-phosphate transferase
MVTTLFPLFLSVALGFMALPAGIRFSRRFSLLDFPSARKRHAAPTPIVGGLCIVGVWTVAELSRWCLSASDLNETRTLAVTIVSLWALVVLGLWDDIRGLSPRFKLGVQTAVAALTLFCEPHVRELCRDQAAGMSPWLVPVLIYAPAMVWIVGVMNALNLVDGIDGFAGGTAFLIASCTLLLNLAHNDGNAFGVASLVLLLPPLMVFLRHNWQPARIFLGDNGSLPIGYLLAVNALTYSSHPNALTGVPCLIVMHAYPILDMGLCTFRRLKNGQPMFKADRGHLHHRVQRLGFSPARTTTMLLTLVAYCQLTAYFISYVPLRLAVIAEASFALTLFIFVFFLRSVEDWRAPVFRSVLAQTASAENHVTVSLESFRELALADMPPGVSSLLESLTLLVTRSIRPSDRITRNGASLVITLAGDPSALARAIVQDRLEARLASFLDLYQIKAPAPTACTGQGNALPKEGEFLSDEGGGYAA